MLFDLVNFVFWLAVIALYFVFAARRWRVRPTRPRFVLYIVWPAIGFAIWLIGSLYCCFSRG